MVSGIDNYDKRGLNFYITLFPVDHAAADDMWLCLVLQLGQTNVA